MIEFMDISKSKLTKIKLIHAAERGYHYLIKMQNYNGAIGITRSLGDLWETVYALQAILLWRRILAREDELVIKRGFDFLQQYENCHGMLLNEATPQEVRRELTLWEKSTMVELMSQNKYDVPFDPSKAACKSIPDTDNWRDSLFCQEVSAEYLSLLLMANQYQVDENIKRKAEYILALQTETGGWREDNVLPEYSQLYPSVTGFVMKACYEGKFFNFNVAHALTFLAETQNDKGYWGADWLYLGIPYYAMDPILLAITKFDQEGKYASVVNKAKKYLTETQRDDGSWYFQLKGWSCYDLPSTEQQTVLALKAYYNTGIDYEHEVVRKGVDFLLNMQHPHGHWYGGYYAFPPLFGLHFPQDVYTTALILLFLYSLIKT